MTIYYLYSSNRKTYLSSLMC